MKKGSGFIKTLLLSPIGKVISIILLLVIGLPIYFMVRRKIDKLNQEKRDRENKEKYSQHTFIITDSNGVPKTDTDGQTIKVNLYTIAQEINAGFFPWFSWFSPTENDEDIAKAILKVPHQKMTELSLIIKKEYNFDLAEMCAKHLDPEYMIAVRTRLDAI